MTPPPLRSRPRRPPAPVTRRSFLRRSAIAAGATAALQFPFVRSAAAAISGAIRVGVIGCGIRGIAAALEALAADPAVRISALADLLPDRLEAASRTFASRGQSITPDRCFAGLDACARLLLLPDLTYVIHATPPAFRPAHFRQIIAAGKPAFLEAPVAVDAPGVRSVLESAELARKRGISVVAGTQRRHQANYRETLTRLRDGALGNSIEARAYSLAGGPPVTPRTDGMSDLEFQVRTWRHHLWLSGDHLVEEHVHRLDVFNWLRNAHPIRALSLGGRQSREHGNNYDHFATEFEYPDGFRLFSYCRQTTGCEDRLGEALLGGKGTSDCVQTIEVRGGQSWRFAPSTSPAKAAQGDGGSNNGHVQAQADLIAALRKDQPLEEATACAHSTLTAILGRLSAYTGKIVEWEQALQSTQSLLPANLEAPIPIPPPPVPGEFALS